MVIFAEEIQEPIEIETMEGVMIGNKGDMLITGLKGNRTIKQTINFELKEKTIQKARHTCLPLMDLKSGQSRRKQTSRQNETQRPVETKTQNDLKPKTSGSAEGLLWLSPTLEDNL